MSSRGGGGGGGHGGGGDQHHHHHHQQQLNEEEQKSLKARVFSVLRATLVPATKVGIPVDKLNREYREFTGKSIPYRDMGYHTLEDFLDQNGDLCRLVRKPDGWYVYGRNTEESAHIARMVTAQRTSKRKAKPKPAPRPRFNPAQQRLWSPTPGGHGPSGYQGGQGGGGQHYNNPSSHQQQLQSSQRDRGFQNNQQNSGPGRQPVHSATNRRFPGGSGRFPGGVVNGGSSGGNAPGGGNRNSQKGLQQDRQHKPALRTPHTNSSHMTMYRDFPPPHPPTLTHHPMGGHHPAMAGPGSMPPPPPMSAMSGPPPPPPSRGGHAQTNNNNQSRSNKNNQQQQKINQQQKPKSSSAPTPQLASDHYRQLLAGWLRAQGCEPCAYKTSPVETKASGNSKSGGKGGKIVKRFLSTVIVNDKRYQTFPEEFPTAEEAEEAVSKIACNKLTITALPPTRGASGGAQATQSGNSQNQHGATTSQSAPVKKSSLSNGHTTTQSAGNSDNGKGGKNGAISSSDTDFGTWSNGMLDGAATTAPAVSNLGDRVISRIVEIVGSRTNGVWSTQIEVEYTRKFKEGLPEKWPAALEQVEEGMARLRVDRPIPGDTCRCIILPNMAMQSNIHASGSESGGNALQLTVDTAAAPAIQLVKSPQPSPALTGSMSPVPSVQHAAMAAAIPSSCPPAGPNGNASVNMGVPPPPPAQPPSQLGGPPGGPPPPPFSGMASDVLHHAINHGLGHRQPPPLTLPTDNLWDVYVTWVNSTTNVRLRILGDKYSALFDELATSMELHYFDAEKMPAVERPLLGKLYAAKVEGDWHRVEVTHVSGPKITCYFIDHGDEDEFSAEDLRELDPKFLDLAPQAKQVRLAHLEEWKDSSEARAELSNMALGKSLVAQLQANDENGVSLILWDTSCDEKDVNINASLRDKLCGVDTALAGGFEDMPPLEHFTTGGGASTKDSSSSASPVPSAPTALASAPSVMGAAPGEKMTYPPMEAVREADLEELFKTELAGMKPLVQTHPPNIEDFFDISVTLAASPSNFTVQSYADEKALEDMQRDMNTFYEKHPYPEGPLNSGHLNKDSYFAGKHSDNVWYRVKVNSMLDEGTAAVKMVDFGDFAMIPLDRMQPLWPRYRNLPMQAINASLADIVAVNGDWSPSDTVWFTQRVLHKQFVSKVKDVVTDVSDPDSYELSVSLFDTSDPEQDIVIDKELVDQNRAVYLCLYQSQNSSIRESGRVR